MTTIEKVFTAITYRMEHEGATYIINETFDENGEPDFNIAITCSNMGHGDLCVDIACDSDEYNRLRKIFYDSIEDDYKNHLVGIYAVSGNEGVATAYRFVAHRDGTVIGIEYADFPFENVDIEDDDLEVIEDHQWMHFEMKVNRLNECLDRVEEYIKTTDQPIKTHGVLPENMPQWAKDMLN